MVYSLPAGPANLAALFPDIDFSQVASYQITFSGGIITPLYVMEDVCDNEVRIHFVNRLGTIDAINLFISSIDNKPSSSNFQRSLQYNFLKKEAQVLRMNIQSADVYTVISADYGEDAMEWLQELVDSPAAWLEWAGDAAQNEAADYVPLLVVDTTLNKRKPTDRFLYQAQLQFQIANPNPTIRNGVRNNPISFATP